MIEQTLFDDAIRSDLLVLRRNPYAVLARNDLTNLLDLVREFYKPETLHFWEEQYQSLYQHAS
jgi:hypothetical protein